MSQITGLKTGTSLADSFIGSVEFTGSVTALADEARAAISNASIYTYGGNDTIIGMAKSGMEKVNTGFIKSMGCIKD